MCLCLFKWSSVGNGLNDCVNLNVGCWLIDCDFVGLFRGDDRAIVAR